MCRAVNLSTASPPPHTHKEKLLAIISSEIIAFQINYANIFIKLRMVSRENVVVKSGIYFKYLNTELLNSS